MSANPLYFVHPDDIRIPENRIRREFDEKKLKELEESILRNGLLNAPVVETEGDLFVLRAGERRLKVLKKILADGKQFRIGTTDVAGGVVPVIQLSSLSELQRLEVEVEENTVRSDFTWQERDRAYAMLHELRTRQNPAQTLTDTATEILGKQAVGSQVSKVSDSVIIAKHLHIPEVAKAKSSKEALKVIQKIADAGQRAKLATAAKEKQIVHRLIKGEALEQVKLLPDASFDVILSDPPYGVDAHQFGDMASTGHDYRDSYKYWKELMSVLPDELYRVTKAKAHVYLFCDQRRFEELKALMVLANFTVLDTMMIWDKSPSGMLPWPDHGPRRTYECILYAWKGDRKTLMVKNDVIHIPAVKKLVHGAQKPVALYLDLLSRSANPGDTVLDLFGGSGPVLVASNRMRLTATYVEDNENAFNIAQLRADNQEIDDGAEEDDGLGDISLG